MANYFLLVLGALGLGLVPHFINEMFCGVLLVLSTLLLIYGVI